jgi:isoleucyl-tRNA synthetase
MRPLEGYQVEREGSHAVALELEIDESLRVEGWAREIVHAVQAARRGAELDISDRIDLTLDGAAELLAAAREYETYISTETLAVSASYAELTVSSNGNTPRVEAVTIDGLELRIAVAKA